MEKHFEALNLLDSDTNWNLTETFSYSKSPSASQIHVQQKFEAKGESSLVRRYSCQQIFKEDAGRRVSDVQKDSFAVKDKFVNDNEAEVCTDSRKFANSQFLRSSSILQPPKFVLNKTSNDVGSGDPQNLRHLNKSLADSGKENTHEPSKIFCGGHVKAIQGSVNKNTSKEAYKDLKKRFRPLVTRKQRSPEKGRSMALCSCFAVCIIPVVTVLFALMINLNTNMVCDRMTLFSNASMDLQEKIYGQKNAVSSVSSHLMSDSFYLKVLCLIGGTGVGKSYTVDIIRKNFPFQNKIFLYDAALDQPLDMNMLSSLSSNHLFIIENLKIKHLDLFDNIVNVISTKQNCTMVIAVFNVEKVNENLERQIDLVESKNRIAEAMTNKKIDLSIVPYESLNEESLELCITRAATESGLILTLDQMNEIKQGLLSSGSGCKGAYGKLQVTGRS